MCWDTKKGFGEKLELAWALLIACSISPNDRDWLAVMKFNFRSEDVAQCVKVKIEQIRFEGN